MYLMQFWKISLMVGRGLNHSAGFVPPSISRRDLVRTYLSAPATPDVEDQNLFFDDVGVAHWFGVSQDEYDGKNV